MRPTHTPARAAGFTLVEILVGLTLGLIAIVIMLQVFTVFDSTKRTTTSGSDAQTTGLISLYSIEREMRMAGYGLVYNNPVDNVTYEGQLACSWLRYEGGSGPRFDRLMPVMIEDNVGNNGSDRITITFSASPFASSPSIVSVLTTQATDLVVRNAPVNDTGTNAVFAQDDVILVGTPLRINSAMANTTATAQHTCTLMRLTAAPSLSGSDVTLPRALAEIAALPNRPDNSSPPAGLSTVGDNTYSYDAATSAPSIVVEMGSNAAGRAPFVRNHYSISANRQLQVQNLADPVAANRTTPVSIGENVVDMQAQYGLVAATCEDNAATCNQIASWVSATGGWVTPSVADAARIKAIRISVITRSSQREVDVATNTCLPFDGTANVPTNASPCRAWPNDANAPQLPWTSTSDWTDNGRFFRYRTYETIIPLRNTLWGNT